jgi:predicted SAM-dependent methyltransferase
MNFGSGSVQPEGWVNVDKENLPDSPMADDDQVAAAGFYRVDITEGGFPWADGVFDYIVANHSLSDLTFHELPHALSELYRVLRPGGVLRVLVPHLLRAFRAYGENDCAWFPQGSDLVDVDERFCTFLTWFGTVGSVFTPTYLDDLMFRAGFRDMEVCTPGATAYDPEITSLDGDRTTALIMEGVK